MNHQRDQPRPFAVIAVADQVWSYLIRVAMETDSMVRQRGAHRKHSAWRLDELCSYIERKTGDGVGSLGCLCWQGDNQVARRSRNLGVSQSD